MEDDYYYYNATDNETWQEPAMECPAAELRGSHVYLPAIYYMIFFSGFFGNLFVISVVGRSGRRGGRLVDTFIVNLALADLIFVTTLPLWALSAGQKMKWAFGVVLCKLSSYVIAVNRFSNIFFLTCMSIDRYLAVVKLLDSRSLRSSRCIHACCAGVWLSSLLLGIPSLMYRKVEDISGDLYCMDDSSSGFFLGMSLTLVFLTFVFPVLVIVFCYGTIIRHLNRHCFASTTPRSDARRRHSVKMVLCIIVAFVVSWLPFNVFKALTVASQLLNEVEPVCGAPLWQRHGLALSCCLAFLNSCVNPGIYFFLDHHFRRQAQSLYKTCGGNPTVSQGYSSSASFTNVVNLDSVGTAGGRSQFQHE